MLALIVSSGERALDQEITVLSTLYFDHHASKCGRFLERCFPLTAYGMGSVLVIAFECALGGKYSILEQQFASHNIPMRCNNMEYNILAVGM